MLIPKSIRKSGVCTEQKKMSPLPRKQAQLTCGTCEYTKRDGADRIRLWT